jgi:hypothetical protein
MLSRTATPFFVSSLIAISAAAGDQTANSAAPSREQVAVLHTPKAVLRTLLAALAVAASWSAVAQDRHITLPVAELEQLLQSEPLRIVSAEMSRPKAKGDITLKAEAAFGDRPPLRVKLRAAEPGAQAFNNVPRYDLAAYELQKLLIDAPEYVTPPTALRMIPVAELRTYAPWVRPTFRGADDVLCVVQYWLQDVTAAEDVLDPARLQTDASYERHVGQLNVFTYLIEHRDSNLGNFLISKAPESARVFAIDNGIAFASEGGDRGELWKSMRVKRLPADIVERLRRLTEADLTSRLSVVAQWELKDGHYVAAPPGPNLSPHTGVRRKDATVQMGLTRSEIAGVWRQAERLRKMISDDTLAVY